MLITEIILKHFIDIICLEDDCFFFILERRKCNEKKKYGLYDESINCIVHNTFCKCKYRN